MQSLRTFLHQALPRIWQRRGLCACLLWPLSQLYAAGWQRKKRQQLGLARNRHLPVPILVVGNVVAGGAGKTPTVIAVVQHFQQLNVQVGVISRGYGRSAQAPTCMAVTAASSAQQVGDEPLLIHRRTGVPVFVGANRFQAAQILLQQHPTTQLLICDDGLQHLALPRQGEICVMDERGIGNGWLLPAGPLREPWPRRTTVLLHNAAQPSAHNTQTAQSAPHRPTCVPPDQPIFWARRQLADKAIRADGQTQPLRDWIQNRQPIVALAGIAQPERFFAMLRLQGLELKQALALPDHAETETLIQQALYITQQGLPIVCTEKDAVKLWPQAPHIWAIPLQLVPEPAFFTALTNWWHAQPQTAGICHAVK